MVQLAIYLWRVRGLRVPTSAATDHVMLAASARPQQVVHSGIFCLQSTATSCCCTIPSFSPCIQVHLDQYNVKRVLISVSLDAFAFPFCSDASSTTNICGCPVTKPDWAPAPDHPYHLVYMSRLYIVDRVQFGLSSISHPWACP